MNTPRLIQLGVPVAILTLCTALPLTSAPEGPAVQPGPAAAAGSALADLTRVLDQLIRNEAAQKKAWPGREADQHAERPPPKAFLEALAMKRALEAQRTQALTRVQNAARRDPASLIDALASTTRPDLARALAPVVALTARGNPKAWRTVEALVDRLDPCPTEVVEALAVLSGSRAGSVLVREGLLRGDLGLLVKAGRTGTRDAITALVDGAEDLANPESAELCLRALERLERPARPDAGLADLLAERVERARSPRIKVALLLLLGQLRSPEHVEFLEKTYADEDERSVRLSILAALGRQGPAAGEFLLAELRRRGVGAAQRKACISALAAARYRPACGDLVELLGTPAYRSAAARALRLISGKNLGERRSAWLHWWRAQPESGDVSPDPDA